MIVSETEYNELYELCESYRIERDAMRGAAYSYKLHCKTLEKENETLRNLLDESFEAQNTVKADTLREMQTRVAVHFGTYTDKDEVKVSDVFKLIDRITQEMVEGE